jgi:hypothetical protein
MNRKRHHLGLVVAVAPIPKRNASICTGNDGAVRDRGAMNISPEVLEDAVAALNDFLAVHNPTLRTTNVGKIHTGRGSPRQPHESTPEQASQLLRRHQHSLVPLRCRDPLSVVGERTTGHEHVDVGMPLESSCPRMQYSESANAPTEVLWITAQSRQCLESGPKEHGQQLPLVTTNQETKLFGQREHHVEVRHRQK